MGARRSVTVAPGAALPAPRAAPATARPPDHFVVRPRVTDFLDAVPDYAATLVVAPAGAGKTAAVAAYTERARAAGITVNWFRPDRVDLLTEALAMAREAASRPVLVVDDAHQLPEDGAAALVDVLVNAPESVRLVLVSRRALGWIPVSALLDDRARSIRVDDLRFTDAEAAVLVRMHHPDASEADLAAVLEQGDGWAAALVLGSRALRASGDPADARASLTATRRPLLDYLLHEVFESLPPDLVRVLLTTCQQDHVTAEEALLLSGVPAAADLLGEASAAGLLVTSYRDDLDGTHGWRYHPLLLDLLRRRTAPTGPDWALVVAAHHRACAEYADRRDAERALLHARLTGDLDLQVSVLREFAGELITRRRSVVVAEALAAVPLEIRSHHQDLLVLHATVLRAQQDIEGAKAAADRALAADARNFAGRVSRDVDAELAALDLWQARFGWREYQPALARARRVLGCRHDGEVSAHDLAGLSGIRAHWLMIELASFEVWLGDLHRAAIHLQDADMYCRRVDLPLLDRSVLALRATLEMVAGAYQSSLASADASLALRDRVPGPPDIADARAHLARGWARLQELDLAGAEQSIATLDATPRDQMDPLLLTYGRLLRACVLTATGRGDEARRLLDGQGDVPARLPVAIEGADLFIRMLIEVSMGDLAALGRTASRMRAAGQPTGAAICDALVLGLGGEEHRAVRLLDGLVPSAVDQPEVVGLTAAVARVALLHRAGSALALDTARQLLPDLLSRAAPQRLLCMLSLGPIISPGFVDLIAEHRDSGAAHPFATEAYDVLSGYQRPYPDLTPHRTPGSDRDADARSLLTPRELEVLEQLALGGANADLARSLFVSENTVKTHLASIYRKLDVERRVDALRVARARGLI
ncbi:helix-turn-helix transcriptional regulator [Nocardioides sp. URHA0032]|uniref:helix-turn-helix transcriptional regulator n=1 Tax=Nocardioides sp. URHA0032 TaxID=1380388 RepID=UPI0009DFE3CD|nr:LuxR C-terminal-related transcriptional regulator [Nocardioides sp. URHA0032]